MTFEYTVDTQEEIQVFKLIGDLIDPAQSAPMMYEVERFISKHEHKFVLDLSELKYMNSSGLNVLIKVLTKARKSGGDVAIINMSKRVNDLLVITKLNGVFNVCTTMQEALAKLQQNPASAQ